MHEGQLAVVRRQAIVDDHLCPLPVRPEVEAEDPGVAVGEVLIGGDDAVEQVRELAEAGHGGQQPAVTCANKKKSALFISSMTDARELQ